MKWYWIYGIIPYIVDVLEVLRELDEFSKRKVDILENFMVSLMKKINKFQIKHKLYSIIVIDILHELFRVNPVRIFETLFTKLKFDSFQVLKICYLDYGKL